MTTLRNSIAAYETSLSESIAQQRRLRKENRASATALKKELEGLQDRLNRVSAAEKSLQTRKIQQNQHMRQAEDAIISLSDEVETIEKSPEDDLSDWKQTRCAWEEQKAAHAELKDKLGQLKTKNLRDIAALEADAVSAQQKRERLQQRSAKLIDQHERLETSNAQGLDEKERQAQEQRAKQAERDQIEISYRGELNQLARKVSELQYRARQASQQSQVLETAFEQQQLMTAQYPYSTTSRPSTPEGDLPGTNPLSATGTSSSANFRFPNFGSPESHLPVNGSNSYSNAFPYQQSHAQFSHPEYLPNQHLNFQSDVSKNRARSLSMLSGNSIYTDFSDQDPAPPMPTRSMVEEMRAQRGSNSESSGGGSSPMVANGSLQGGWTSNGSRSGSAHGWNGIGTGNAPSGSSSAVTQIWKGRGGSPGIGTGFVDRSLH